ncbi:MAG TPA: LysM peptidoglycan-binding domain-containing protein [Phycisphaerales bacterium]|nr:LysM peptidoglycan-binding domain-containing protein [Phycisphaerales bacterium]
MTREQKLALILGFALVLVVGVLVSDHLSSAGKQQLGRVEPNKDLGTGTLDEPGLGRNLAFLNEPKPTVINTSDIREKNITSEPLPKVDNGPEVKQAPRDPFMDRVANNFNGATNDLLNGKTPHGVYQLDPVEPVTQVEKKPSERTHTIAEGDTLWSIATRYYGSGAAHKKLAEYNASRLGSSGELRVGASLLIPTAEQLGLQTAATHVASNESSSEPATHKEAEKKPETTDKPGTYTVKSGDTLAGIARKTLGSAGRWEDILALNTSKIDDETSIPPGTVLKLPKR